MFLIWQKHCLFGGRCWGEVFQILCDYNRAQGLAIHTRFDDLDVISRSQVWQNRKLQVVFKWCMVAIHIKTIKHSILCVTGVYWKDITNTIFVILHLIVSYLSKSLIFFFHTYTYCHTYLYRLGVVCLSTATPRFRVFSDWSCNVTKILRMLRPEDNRLVMPRRCNAGNAMMITAGYLNATFCFSFQHSDQKK